MKHILTVLVAFILSPGVLADELLKNSERIAPQKFSGLKETRVPEEVILDSVSDEFYSEDDAMSRRELAELFSNSVNIEAGQVYSVYFSGQSCVKFSVSSTPEDLHVMLMESLNFQTFQANDYSGSYLYIQGSQCLQTYSCSKTVSGLSSSNLLFGGSERL